MNDPPDGEAPLSKRRFYGVIGTLIAVEILSSLESNMIYTALPTIMREFSDPHMTGWLLTGFLLVQAGAAAIGGRLGDIYGRRRMLIILIAICAVGSLISAVGQSLELIILGRALQGMSGAILPLCYGITHRAAPPGRAPFWIGVVTGAFSFSTVIGYLVAGHFSDTGAWRSIFWFTAIYAVLLPPLLLLLVPEFRTRLSGRRLDILGGLLFVPAVGSILYGLTLADKFGWTSAGALSFISGGVSLTAIWVWYEARHLDPLIDVRLLRRPKIALGNICGVFTFLGVVQLPMVMMMILQQPLATGVGLGVTATFAAVLKLPSNVAALFSASLAGWVAGRCGSRWAVCAGGLVGATGWMFLYAFHGSVLEIAIGSIIVASASGMLLAGLPNLLIEDAPADRTSEVTGLASVSRGIAGAVGAQTIVAILATSRVSAPGLEATFPSEAAYRGAFLYIAATALVTAAVALFVKGRGNVAAANPGAEPPRG